MKQPLIAKKAPAIGNAPSLREHTLDVCEAAEALFGKTGKPSRLCQSWLRFFRMDSTNAVALLSNLKAACLIHDWGKANADMQSVLYGEPRAQLFRHEHLSVAMMTLPHVRKCLQTRTDIDWDVVASTIGCHHLKFSEDEFLQCSPNVAVEVYFDSDAFRTEILALTAEQLGLTHDFPAFTKEKYWGSAKDATFQLASTRASISDAFFKLTKACRDEKSDRGKMLRAVRAALIVADGAGSGLRRTGQSIASWIAHCFNESNGSLCDFGFVENIIQKRLSDLQKLGKWKGDSNWNGEGWNIFQKACDDLPDRSVLLAPCGSGKTLAAWRWIAARVKERPVKRILFLYPTRATATEGFKDYVSWAPEADAALMHGTSGYDLEGMFPAEDPREGMIFKGADPRLFALQHWNKRVFSATVDQFFSFLSYSYGPMCLLPLIADSVIVIDEVHSFDQKMFSGLRSFLRAFDVPVLCMTATLQSGRKEQLKQAVANVYEDRPEDLAKIANAARYHVVCVDEQSAMTCAIEALQKGSRVLWVVNQVSRAQNLAQQLKLHVTQPVICYHSRFKLSDRRERHRETVDAISAEKPACIAITTQVCEMSLDIDADVVITERCPISSVIQRMGRCRRGRDELATKGAGSVYVYQPDSKEFVYTNADLFGVDDFLGLLQSKSPVSQTDLENGLRQFGSTVMEAERLSSFLKSGPYAVSGEDSFRDIEEFSFQCVLDTEISDFLSARPDERPGFVCPVPKKLKPEIDRRLPQYLRVGLESHYEPKTGYHDAPFMRNN